MELIRINGNTEIITSLDCALEVVDKYLGQELARYIKEEYVDKISELQDTMQACIRDNHDAVEELLDKLKDTKRINQKTLIEKLEDIKDSLEDEM